MYTEQTSHGKYAIQDLTKSDLELIKESLVCLKHSNTEAYSENRDKIIRIYTSIVEELK